MNDILIEDAEEKIKCAILRILNLSSLKLFGCLIYNFKINYIDTDAFLNNLKSSASKEILQDKLTANISVQNGKAVINIYSSFIKSHTVPELTCVLIHEIMHFINGDCIYKDGHDETILNISADHIINQSLKKDISNKVFDFEKVEMPYDHFIIPELESKNLTKSEVYEWILNKDKNPKKTEIFLPIPSPQSNKSSNPKGLNEKDQNDTGPGQSNQSDQNDTDPKQSDDKSDGKSDDKSDDKADGKSDDKSDDKSDGNINNKDLEDQDLEDQDLEDQDLEDQDLEDQDLENEKIIKIIISSLNINGQEVQTISDVNTSNELEAKLITEQIRSEARATIENILPGQRGHIGGNVFELIKKMLEVNIPWDKLLNRAICSKILPDEDSKTWTRLKKRPMSLGLLLPGTDDEEKPCYLIVVCDTSGSINTSDLERFSSIILQSAKYFDVVRVIKHDTVITDDTIIESQYITSDDIIFKFDGRGGTSHTQVFNKIEKMFENDIEISLVIFLTDFYSNIEEIWHTFEWVKQIPVCICLTIDHAIVPEYIDKNPIIIKNNK